MRSFTSNLSGSSSSSAVAFVSSIEIVGPFEIIELIFLSSLELIPPLGFLFESSVLL